MPKYFAIPLHADGREMLGTHGWVDVDGNSTGVAVLSGEYISPENCIRYLVSRYGVSGVTYSIQVRTHNGAWIPKRTYRKV